MEERVLNATASYIQEAMEKFAKKCNIKYDNAIDYFKEYFEFLKEKESGNNIDRLVDTIFMLSIKNYSKVVGNGEDSVYVYPYRVLIFNKLKDGQLYFNGTDEELNLLCNKVTEKYIEYFDNSSNFFEAQKTKVCQKNIVESIEAHCKSLLLKLEVRKTEKRYIYEQMVNNRRKSQRKNRKGGK